MRRPIELTGSVRVGPWLAGIVTETGTGLSYLPFGRVYCVLVKIDGVAKLTRYAGRGIEERNGAGFGERISVE